MTDVPIETVDDILPVTKLEEVVPPQPQQRPPILSINPQDLRNRGVKVFVATPMYGGQGHGMFFKSCLELQNLLLSHGIEVRFSFLFNESLITRARNYLVEEFLTARGNDGKEFTHLLFIDSDIEFQPVDVMALLALDKDVIGGPYPKKSINWRNILKASAKILSDPNIDKEKFNPGELEGLVGEYVFNLVPGTTQFSVLEPIEVLEIGTGFMMVKKEVFAKFAEEYPHLSYKPDHVGQPKFDGSKYIHAFFDTVIDPDSHRYLSEDYMFCQYWRNIGGSIWLCPWMKTKHIGSYAFNGDLQRIAAMTASL